MSVQVRVALLIALFAAGYLARRRGWLQPSHAGRMLQLVITVGLPALFLADVSRIPLQRELIALPVSCVLIILVTLGLSLLLGSALKLPRATQGAFTICSMSVNNGFLFPFVIAVWGQVGFAHLALFDLGNALCAGSLVYAIAAWYGGHGARIGAVLRRVASFPPLWALIAALSLNGAGLALPEWLVTMLGTIGRLILLLVIVALGVLFDARLLRDSRVLATVALRIVAGLALGFCCVWLFGLQGITRSVVLLGSAAPIGFSAVVIANREQLNRELAASAASVSVLLALAYVPLALWLLRH
ncbi:MAG: AEC family transporter [Steroidobacteraceae bacterium]